MSTHSTTKTSVSIKNPLWQKLKQVSNRSQIINEALTLYFNREDYLNQAKQDYWQNVYFHLQNNTGEYTAINPKQETVDEDLLEQKLWS